MDRLVIRGGRRIEGSVQICGAKNAVLPQIAAALLSSERLELGNVPEVTDVTTMLAMMEEFGVVATRGPGRILVLDASGARNSQAPYDMVRRMRASILVLAPLLARFGSARVSMPGGCYRRAADRPTSQGTGRARGRCQHRVRVHSRADQRRRAARRPHRTVHAIHGGDPDGPDGGDPRTR